MFGLAKQRPRRPLSSSSEEQALARGKRAGRGSALRTSPKGSGEEGPGQAGEALTRKPFRQGRPGQALPARHPKPVGRTGRWQPRIPPTPSPASDAESPSPGAASSRPPRGPGGESCRIGRRPAGAARDFFPIGGSGARHSRRQSRGPRRAKRAQAGAYQWEAGRRRWSARRVGMRRRSLRRPPGAGEGWVRLEALRGERRRGSSYGSGSARVLRRSARARMVRTIERFPSRLPRFE